MQEYITRQEFEELKEMLLCRGDGQTVEVDHTPGGQTIRSISVTTPEAEAVAETEYITATYDDGTGKITFQVTDLPVTILPASGTLIIPRYESNPSNLRLRNGFDITETLIFDKPTVATTTIYIGMKRNYDTTLGALSETLVVWDGDANTVVTDATTLKYNNTGNIAFSEIARLKITTSGGITLLKAEEKDIPIIVGPTFPGSRLYVNSTARRLYWTGIDPLTLGDINNYITYTEPVDEDVYIGWNNGAISYSLVFNSDKGSYDKSIQVGKVQINSSNIVTQCENYNIVAQMSTIPIGFTGTATTGDTIAVVNGIVTNIT